MNRIRVISLIMLLPVVVLAQGQWSGTQTDDYVAIGTDIVSGVKLYVHGKTALVNSGGERNLMIESNDADSWVTFHDPGNYWYSMGIDRADGRFKLNVGGELGYANHFSMTSVGKIGIGTTEPSHQLSIHSASTDLLSLKSTSHSIMDIDAGGGFNSYIRFRNNNNIRWDIASENDGNLRIYDYVANASRIVVTSSGNVGIGTTTPGSFKLAVNGKTWTQEVNVQMTNPGPDYVFEPTYNLTPLSEVETFIKSNKHLPEVPSAKQMAEEGLNLKEMNLILLKKVEELTLHLIEQGKVNDEQGRRLKEQESEIQVLKQRIK